MHTGEGGERASGQKIGHKNTIKHIKRYPLDFLTTPNTPFKKFGPKNPQP
jgi:hypothetical protein